MKRLPIGLALAAAALTAAAVSAQGPLIQEGEPFPDLVFPSLADGAPSSIAQFRGKKVVLHVFASW